MQQQHNNMKQNKTTQKEETAHPGGQKGNCKMCTEVSVSQGERNDLFGPLRPPRKKEKYGKIIKNKEAKSNQ